jgi:hypothetical protein
MNDFDTIREAANTIATAIDRHSARLATAMPAAVAMANAYSHTNSAERLEVAEQLDAYLDGKPALKPSHRRAIECAARLLRG